nr:ATP-binding protein [Streptomyces sp. AmelKG-D3]
MPRRAWSSRSPRSATRRARTSLTSNKTFSECGQVLGEEVLATAIVDRLLHHCEVVPINGPNYRLKNRLQAIEREAEVA